MNGVVDGASSEIALFVVERVEGLDEEEDDKDIDDNDDDEGDDNFDDADDDTGDEEEEVSLLRTPLPLIGRDKPPSGLNIVVIWVSPFKAFVDDTDEGVAEETEAAELVLVATGEEGNTPPLAGTNPPSSTHETAKSRSGRSTNDEEVDEAFGEGDESSCTAS